MQSWTRPPYRRRPLYAIHRQAETTDHDIRVPVYIQHHDCLCLRLHSCVPLHFLGILAFCETCPFPQGTEKYPWFHFLGHLFLFAGDFLWILSAGTLYLQFPLELPTWV